MSDLKPQVSPYVLGIDLGTSNSSASVYYKGSAHTISLKDGKIIPSVVRFGERKKSNVQVGKEAKKYLRIKPEEVFSSIKRLMKNDDWKKYTFLMEKFNIEDQQLEPVHISAEILKKMMEEVYNQTEFDLKGEIRKAVICVPANTTDEYRKNVYKAAEMAGIGELDENGSVIVDANGKPQGVALLEEPTAAALAYGYELGIFSSEKEQTILVYDLGGGTFDVTILKVDSTIPDSPPQFTVIATKGVAQLGGDDLDKVVMDICIEEFGEETGIDIYDLRSDQNATSPKELKKAQQKLKESAEEAKINFANGKNVEEIIIPEFLKDGEGSKYDLEVEIKKSDFLERVNPFLEQAKECVLDVLKEANLSLDDINRVITVGGSTKADWVINSLKSLYPSGEEREPYRAKDVDVIVSQGAAIFGEFKSRPADEIGEEKIELHNIVSHHLGIELEGGVFGLILEKGLSLDDEMPVQSATRIYGNQENQSSLQIVVWKTQKTIELVEEQNGEENIRKEKEKSSITERDAQGNPVFECIGEFTLNGIPLGPRASQKIEVTMEIDQENLLKVSAKLLGGESMEEVELNISQT